MFIFRHHKIIATRKRERGKSISALVFVFESELNISVVCVYICTYIPVNEDVATPETSRVNEVVTQRKELGQVLARRVRGQHTEVVFVLHRENTRRHAHI